MVHKIAAISNHADFIGGGEHSFIDLIHNLSGKWKPFIIIPSTGELFQKRSSINMYVIPLPPLRPWNIANILLTLIQFLKLFIKNRPKLIYANGSRSAIYSDIIGQILKIPVLWHCRIAEPDKYLDFLLCRLCTRIITNSKATSKRFKPRFMQKIHTVYNGVNIEWLQNDNVKKPAMIQPDWKIILVVARISRWKRHDLALSAFEKIAPSDSKIHLVCVGAKDKLETRWYDYLMLRTKQSPFSDRIHWIGKVTDVRPWYRSADLFLLPSENEPFGRVIVEAMACGVPIVATNGGGVPEIITHGQDGLLVSAGNVDEMANAIQQIISNRLLRDKIIQNGKERVNDFSLDAHLKEMIRVFKETING